MITENEYLGIRLPACIYEKIEKAVVELYRELNLSRFPIDPFDIAERKGYIVKRYSDLPPVVREMLRDKERDGISHYDPEAKTFVIYYDDNKPYTRCRFTIMHEIGHITLGHREESNLARKMADCFAGYFLAPSPLIFISNCEDYMDIANKFNVSPECADICFQRFENWLHYGGENFKDYEIALLRLFGEKRSDVN